MGKVGCTRTSGSGGNHPDGYEVSQISPRLSRRHGSGPPVWTGRGARLDVGGGDRRRDLFPVRFSRDPRSISLSGNPRTTPGSFPPNTGEDGESRLRAQFPGRTIPIVDGSTPEWTQAGSVEGGRGTVWMESLDVWWSQGVRPVVERRGGGVRSR